MTARNRKTPKDAAKPGSVSIGRARVRIYHRKAERGRPPFWQVADYSSGKRRWRVFPTEAEAKAEAARIAHRLNALDHAGASMTGDDARDLARARASLEGVGLDVPAACALFAEACRVVGGHAALALAARDYAKRHVARPLPVGEAVADLLAAREAKGRSERLLQDYRHRLSKFSEHFQGRNLGDLDTAAIQAWVDGLAGRDGKPLGPQSRRNFATVASGLFEFARKRGAILENPCRDLDREKVRKGDVLFWSPQEAAAILDRLDPAAVPAFVVALFAGCRTAEVLRLTWASVDLAAGHVAVGGAVAKTQSRRLAPLPDNAVQWLRPLVGAPDARLFDGDPGQFAKLVTQACADAGVPRLANGARHSCITYRVALSGDVARVALESGNSPTMVHAHYRGLATADDAKTFFSIVPRAGKGVLREVA